VRLVRAPRFGTRSSGTSRDRDGASRPTGASLSDETLS
jgi:hypothetical protein